MTLRLRYFVPAGGRIEHARLQHKLIPVMDIAPEEWRDIPVVYEDPDDEVVACPRVKEASDSHSPVGRSLCALCYGTGWLTKGALKEAMAKNDQ